MRLTCREKGRIMKVKRLHPSGMLVPDSPSSEHQVDAIVRPAVLRFAQDMEFCLKTNDHKGGWEDEDFDWLFDRIKDEFKEARKCYKKMGWVGPYEMNKHQKQEMISEFADIANFAMMCADKIRQTLTRGDEPPKEKVK